MKRVLAALAALAIAAGTAEASDALKAVVGSYLQIQAQLAADKHEGIKAHAAAIASSAGSMGEAGAALVKAAKAVEQAADLKTARQAFGPLSDAVIAAADAEGWKDLADVKLAYCPMAPGSWLQKDAKIRNPYYGSMMLECGEFKEPKRREP